MAKVAPYQVFEPEDVVGLVTEDMLGHRYMTEPQWASKVATMIHAVNKGITMYSYISKFPTLYLESDDKFKWTLISNAKKNVPLIKASLTSNGSAVSPTDKVGVDYSEFYLTFPEPWFSDVNLIVGERNELYPIRILDDPREIGGMWEYRCQLNLPSRDSFIPYEELQRGKRFSKDFSPVERTLSSKGGKHRSNFPFEMQNWFTQIRMERQMPGNMLDRPLRIAFQAVDTEGNKKTFSTWFAYDSYNFEMEYQDEKAKMFYYSTMNMLSNGVSPFKGKSGHVLQTGAGLRQQIKSSNDWSYNIFDIEELTALMLDMSVGKIPTAQRAVALSTGEYGLVQFSKNIENYSTLYTPNRNESRIYGSGSNMGYQGQFMEFKGPNGIEFSAIHDALKDDIERNKIPMPGKRGLAESYVYDIMNLYKSDGGYNIQRVEKKSGGESSGYIDGMRSPYKKDGGVMSTPIDGWEEHRMFIGGAIVFDPTTCAVYSPQID